MTSLVFPDNTVLCNFACVNRLDLLRTLLGDRGKWTAAIAFEADRSSRSLPGLATIRSDGWLGEPIEVTDDREIQLINQIRRAVFGGSDDEPLKHLGEAETCFLIKNRSEFAESSWITDDEEALRYARFQGITAHETIDLMITAVINGDITAQAGYDLMLKMADEGRGLRLPTSTNELRG